MRPAALPWRRLWARVQLSFPKEFQSLLDPVYVLGRAHEFESIEKGHLALCCDFLRRQAVGGAEVRIAGTDHAAQQAPVLLAVEEFDDLRRNRVPAGFPAIGGQHQ